MSSYTTTKKLFSGHHLWTFAFAKLRKYSLLMMRAELSIEFPRICTNNCLCTCIYDIICPCIIIIKGQIIRIMCILCTYQPILDQCIGRHIGRVSVDMSTDISVESRAICRPRCVGRHVHRHISRASVDMSTDPRPICWPICRPRVIVQLSADMSIDRLPTFRRYFTAICPCCVTWNRVIHIASYHYLRNTLNIPRKVILPRTLPQS